MIIVPSNVAAAEPVVPVLFRSSGYHTGLGYSPGNSWSLPTHQAGDVILLFFSNFMSDVTAPTPGGNVPAWTKITGADGVASVWYTVATASNHVTGVFSGDGGTWQLIMSVFSGANTSDPIGAYGLSQVSNGSSSPTHALSLTNTNGSSQVVHMSHIYGDNVVGAYSPNSPASPDWQYRSVGGWTAPNGTNHYLSVFTKNATTSAPSANVIDNTGYTSGYAKATTVEIKS